MGKFLTIAVAGSALALVSVATATAQPRDYYGPRYTYDSYYGYYRGSPRHYGWKPGYPHYNADDYYNQHRQLQGTR